MSQCVIAFLIAAIMFYNVMDRMMDMYDDYISSKNDKQINVTPLVVGVICISLLTFLVLHYVCFVQATCPAQ
jgi:ABC-type arginine transport system permease subunit